MCFACIWVYWTFSWILFQSLMKGQEGFYFPMFEATWIEAYDFCLVQGRRLVYSTVSMHDHMVTDYDSNLMTVWTIHKVKNETPKDNRSHETVPYTIEYSLDDLSSVLCVYFVYEELQFRGWEADDCNNESVVHIVLCTDKSYSITAFPKLTFHNEERIWTYSEKYCDYAYYSNLIGLFEQIYFVTLFQDSRKQTLTSMIQFWSEPSSEEYRKVTSVVVFDESVCQSCHGEIFSYFPSSEYQLPDGLLFIDDCTYIFDAMVCEDQTDLKLFVEMSSAVIVNKVSLKNILVSSTVECEEQCIALTTYGINCAGFNYNWTLQECSLLSYLDDCKCSNFLLSKTEGMSAFLVRPYSIIVRESNPITIDIHRVSPELRIQDNDDTDSADSQGSFEPTYKPGSTGIRIQDNGNTDPMITSQQPSTLVERATTTKPFSTIGDNAAASTIVERTTTKASSTVGDNAAAITGGYKTINKLGSTELGIKDNDNADQPTTVGYKTINKPGSTELGIEDNDNTYQMVTDQQATTGGYKTINKPGSTELGIENNDNTYQMVTDQQATTGGYKTINKPGSTELGIENNDNTYQMVTDQQASTIVERAKPTIAFGDNHRAKTGSFKPINKPGSTEIRIQENDITDLMVPNQQPSTLLKTAATTKPTSRFGENDAGRVLTTTMGLIGAVACGILIYNAASMLHQVTHMNLTLADGKITRNEVEEQIYDTFTIEMSEEDGERILAEGVTTFNVPPNCHLKTFV